jgi:transposase
MAGLSGGVRAVYDDLQPLQPMEQTRGVGGRVLRACRVEWSHLFSGGGLDLRQGAPIGGRRKRGAFIHAIGRSRGGRTTKVHAITDQCGRPVAFTITPGNTHDLVGAEALLQRAPLPRKLIADRAYDARKLRDWLAARGCEAVIPPNPTRKHPHTYDAEAYKTRNLIERMFCRLKDFRRIATRYDKRADTYLSSVLLAAAIIWWIN